MDAHDDTRAAHLDKAFLPHSTVSTTCRMHLASLLHTIGRGDAIKRLYCEHHLDL